MSVERPGLSNLGRLRVVRRGMAELLVITLGVLIALAADRWNQARQLAESTSVYIDRLAEEIRGDSLAAAEVRADLPAAWATRDSLLAAVRGESSLPADLQSTTLNTFLRYDWAPPVAWTELNNTGLLGMIDDLELRRLVSEYYAERSRYELFLDSAEERGRNPYVAALYPLGWMEEGKRAQRSEAFLQWPGMEGLLLGLGGHLSLLETFAPLIEHDAGEVLQLLDSPRD